MNNDNDVMGDSKDYKLIIDTFLKDFLIKINALTRSGVISVN